MKRVFVSGAFDDARSPQLRFLHEASRIGPVTLLLWPDAAVAALRGSAPRMGLEERAYYFEALRYVDRVEAAPADLDPDRLDFLGSRERGEAGAEGAAWALYPSEEGGPEAASPAKLAWCRSRHLEPREIPAAARSGFPYAPPSITSARAIGRKRVVVTGCYDWLHTGHLRFFEEASEYGELNVVIGSDANVRLLKGEGHPLFPEEERSYVAGSFRSVMRCLVSSGKGWLDAEPEIRALRPDRYVVNEDGDKAEKRLYCEENGIEYIVLKRTPKEGLPRRSSTDLRGF
jgi:cytidyltransferase-like protein